MRLYSLIKNLNCRVFGNISVEITGLYHNDVEVKDGGMFFCLRGTKVDGVEYVKSAVKNGAIAIVVEQEIPQMFGVTQIIVNNSREAMSIVACNFFGNPANKLKLIGVTGTNGKTTITTVLADVLKGLKKKVAVVGTNGVFIDGIKYETNLTTPDPIQLQKYFSIMVKRKVEYVCIEVSAHALDLCKIAGVRFELGIFTNLTEDHLDYFKTMEKYYLAKQKFFNPKYIKYAIINADDDYGKRLCEGIKVPKNTYSILSESNCIATEITLKKGKQSFAVGNKNITINLLGEFNIYNILAVYLACKKLGLDENLVVSELEKVDVVDGRFNIIEISGRCFVVDYAHTPDGLENILKTCKKLAGDGKLISVFGCGGNREVQKRAKMGEISTKIANFSIFTSDNPRFEKREAIIRDIEKGAIDCNYMVVEDRAEAIKKAYDVSNVGDVIVVAGKGAEPYIDEMGVKSPYSDKSQILKLGGFNEWFMFSN